jgi:hypothetical protein
MWLRRSHRNLRALFFPGLSKQAGYAFVAAFGLAWLAAMIAAIPWFPRGGPGDPIPGCRWTLDNHGAITCVSHATYLHAGAAVQRFAAGIVAGFSSIHLGAVTSELGRRRDARRQEADV